MKSIIVLHVQTLNDISDIILIMKFGLHTTVEQVSYRQTNEIIGKSRQYALRVARCQ